jgi:hypothetical protein
MAPGTGCGEFRGESPRGELVRCVPKDGAPCEVRAFAPGVVGPFGAAKGPVCVGVIALVVAAMAASFVALWRVTSAQLAHVQIRHYQAAAQRNTGMFAPMYEDRGVRTFV